MTVTAKSNFRIGVLGSGKGSNFSALAKGCSTGAISAEIAMVLSDVEDSGILARARSENITAQFISPGKFRTKLDDEAEGKFIEALLAARVDLIALAGFMRILKGALLRTFEGKIVNIHPSLLPSFPGLEAWKQALEYGVKVSGCTVHYVDAGVDAGPIVGQEVVAVNEGDTPDSLHARIQAAEQTLYPRCVSAIARGEVTISGRRVRWHK